MTRQEPIKLNINWNGSECPITRKQVEKMRGEWVYMTDDDGCAWPECSRCEYGLDSLEEPQNFCRRCGSAMTDEAVDILWNRLEAMRDDE